MGVTMQQLQPHRFLVRFYLEADIARILADGPWTFEQCLLVMQRVPVGVDPELMALQDAEFWVQIHALPVGFRSEVVVAAIGSFLGTLIHTDEKNFDGSMRLYYRVRVAIDISKPLKKQMKMKRENGSWAFVDFRYERLPTFCFLCGVIGHGDKHCPKFIHGFDPKAEKPFGAFMRAGSRRSAPSTGLRWVAPESNADRLLWRSPVMDGGDISSRNEVGDKGKGPMHEAVGTNALVPIYADSHAEIPAVVMHEQKRKRSDEGASEQIEGLR